MTYLKGPTIMGDFIYLSSDVKENKTRMFVDKYYNLLLKWLPFDRTSFSTVMVLTVTCETVYGHLLSSINLKETCLNFRFIII